jgi:hypothetical protein
MTGFAAIVGALVGAIVFAVLTWLASLAPPSPTTQWVKLDAPVKDGFTSYLPCVRTSGWLLPHVTCYPSEARSELMTLHGPGPDCRLPDPMACREPR